ncbi:Thioredoxin [Leuconostoc pseudomesenteroides 4882]|nr:Thioredoxin [Leuconostoc pseudomesenteroides 4882]
MMDPILHHLSDDSQLGNQIKFTSINIDDNQQTAAQLGIQGIPTLIIKNNGQIIDKIVGFHPKEEIENILKKHIEEA